MGVYLSVTDNCDANVLIYNWKITESVHHCIYWLSVMIILNV